MATLSRLWMPTGSSGHANSIEDFIVKNHDLLILRLLLVCIYKTSLEKIVNDDACTIF
jgi:hypothetical protein